MEHYNNDVDERQFESNDDNAYYGRYNMPESSNVCDEYHVTSQKKPAHSYPPLPIGHVPPQRTEYREPGGRDFQAKNFHSNNKSYCSSCSNHHWDNQSWNCGNASCSYDHQYNDYKHSNYGDSRCPHCYPQNHYHPQKEVKFQDTYNQGYNSMEASQNNNMHNETSRKAYQYDESEGSKKNSKVKSRLPTIEDVSESEYEKDLKPIIKPSLQKVHSIESTNDVNSYQYENPNNRRHHRKNVLSAVALRLLKAFKPPFRRKKLKSYSVDGIAEESCSRDVIAGESSNDVSVYRHRI